MPLPVKYSCLPMNTISRSSIRGRKKESITARWLLARMAGPSVGTFSAPRTQGRYTSLSRGPTKMCFISQ